VVAFKYLIIGAGPAGLAAAHRLAELGIKDFLVCEAQSHVGGLSASFKDDHGFVWDIGGHVLFSHYEYFDTLMTQLISAENWLKHERESWVWIRDRFVPYPLQNNIRHLPRDDAWKCLSGLVELSRSAPQAAPKSFAEWIDATFGKGLREIFMEPYNFKVWAHSLDQLSSEWIGERVAVTDLARVLHNYIYEKDDLSWGPNHVFQFPRHGGTGAIWRSLADRVGPGKIRLGTEVLTIHAREKRVMVSGGETFEYESLLNTMPIDRLFSSIEDAPSEMRQISQNMKYSSSNIVGVGIRGKIPEHLKTKCWMYFPESNCPFYRVTVFSNYSPNNVPEPGNQWSLMAEVSESPFKPVEQSRLLDDVIQGLRATNLIGPTTEVLSTWRHRAEYGYPTPFLGRDAALRALHGYLEPLSIFSRGRFGGWKYEVANQDHSVMQGVEWVNRIVLNEPETTYHS